MVTSADAASWLGRWDRQQEVYMADREERFAVIADVVEAAVGRPDPLILDAGVGPGSLAVRLLDRVPAAQVVGIDADPLLLGLAQAAYGERNGLRLVEADLRGQAWAEALRLDRPADAIVSTTALHWLDRRELLGFYLDAADLLRPGGVLVNGDHLFDRPGRPAIDEIAARVAQRRALRALGDREEATESWAEWWHAAREAPELSDLIQRRDDTEFDHTGDESMSVDTHLQALRAAGYAEAGTVWQHGDDRVLVAVR